MKLKLLPDHTYKFRFFPFETEQTVPQETRLHYVQTGDSCHKHVGWKGDVYICPRGDCVLCRAAKKMCESLDDTLRKYGFNLFAKKRWDVPVYVIEDSSNPDNDESIRIFSYGKAVQNFIMYGTFETPDVLADLRERCEHSRSAKLKVKLAKYESIFEKRFHDYGASMNGEAFVRLRTKDHHGFTGYDERSEYIYSPQNEVNAEMYETANDLMGKRLDIQYLRDNSEMENTLDKFCDYRDITVAQKVTTEYLLSESDKK